MEVMELCLAVREKEGRLYSDEEVRRLPNSSRHTDEWKIRRQTAEALRKALKGKNVLEIGCGNGWLTNYLGATGIDINEFELEQAKRVFGDRFILGDLCALCGKKYDTIIFAASIQYFKNLEIIKEALEIADEIHIVDSCFYSGHLTAEAAERSKNYYESLGFPEMSNYYFHHSLDDLKPFNYKIIKEKKPFYWIRITK